MRRFQSLLARLFGLAMLLLLSDACVAAQALNLDRLWNELADQDAAKAYRAIGALALNVDKAIPFLQARLHPVIADRKVMDKLVRDLDSEVFAEREQALADLERLGEAAEGPLKERLTQKPGLEQRRRIEILLAKLPDPAASPTLIRQARALEALELAGTPDALKLLQHLATGTSAARWTQLAKASHDRLAARPKPIGLKPSKVDAYGDPLPAGVLARLGTGRMQNADFGAFSTDNKFLITASDNALNVWDLTAGKNVASIPDRKWFVTSAVAVSQDGSMAAVLHNGGGEFDVFDLRSGKAILNKKIDTRIATQCFYTLTFGKDGKTLVVSSQSHAHVWNLETGKETQRLSYNKDFNESSHVVVLSLNGARLATWASIGSVLRIWDVGSGKLLHEIGQKGFVHRAVFGPDGKKLLTGSEWGRVIRLWDSDTGKLVHEFKRQADSVTGDPTPSFAFSPDGATIALTDSVRKDNAEQQILIWNLGDLNGKPRIIQPPPGIGWIEGFSHDGKWLLWRNSFTAFRLLDVSTGKDRHGWPYRGVITAIAYAPDGTRMATGCSDGTVSFWQPTVGKLLRTAVGNRTGIGSVAFSPDSKFLISCGGDKEPAVLWDATRGERKFPLDNNQKSIPGVYWAGFSADSKLLYTGGHTVYRGIFDTTTGKLHGQFEVDRQSTWNMAFSADGRFAASGIDSVCIYDVLAKRIQHTVPSSQCVGHAFSHDSRTLAVLNNGRDNQGVVVLWEVLTGRERARLEFPKAYLVSGQLAFSPDGRTVAAACVGRFRMWDLAALHQVDPFPAGIPGITAFAFSPDSRFLATGSRDGTVLIREIRSNKEQN